MDEHARTQRVGDDRELALRLLDYLLETVTVFDREGRVRYSTGDRNGILGWAPGHLAGNSGFDLVHPDDRDRVAAALAKLLEDPTWEVADELRVADAAGGWQWIEGIARNRLDDPVIQGIVVSTRNITSRVDAQNALRHSEERFRALVAFAADLSMVIDLEGRLGYVSPASTSVLGYAPEELCRLASFVELVHPDDDHRVRAAIDQIKERPGARTQLGFRASHRDGSVRHVEANITNLLHDPSVEGIVVNLHDVSERKEFEHALSHQAMHDPLTGLPNRALLTDRIRQAIARRQTDNEMIVVLLVDLDRFKLVNDSLGHAAGDRLLVEVGRRLETVLRPADTVARLGGDEFVVLCADVTASGVSDLPRRLLRAVSAPVCLPGAEVTVTASIGVAVADHTHRTPDDLVRDADAAMYLAKEQGRNRFALFDERLRVEARGRLDIENALRQALPRQQLELHYQPILSLDPAHLLGVEALVRWNHPERGMLMAADFVPMAEDTGLIVPIGTWALGEATAAAARWADRYGRPPGLTWVNLAARQLADPELLASTRRLLEEHSLEPNHLGFEITETGLMREPETAMLTLASLRELGVSLALDDFGTGYSSLAYLRRFEVDVVKIDQSFVSRVTAEERSEEIVRAVVAMAHALGMTVVAEGVESEEQLRAVADLGCDAAQGNHLAEPVPADDLERSLPSMMRQ